MKRNTKVIREKRAKLENASTKLKAEFFGIDKCIDEIIHYIEPWYYYPELQDRPTIINLWGLTGTGKTDLVRKLVRYLCLDEFFFHSESSSIGSYRVMHSFFSETFGTRKKKQAIICLDEFQFMGKGMSDFNASGNQSQKLWNLIDSGLVQFIEYDHSYDDLKDFVGKLRAGISRGVKVKKGMITKNAHEFLHLGSVNSLDTKIRNEHSEIADFGVKFTMFQYRRDKWEDYFQFIEAYKTLDEKGILKLAEEVVYDMGKPKTYDASNSLVFVIANLDEAYSMTGNMNPDEDADIYYKHSLRISPIDIKECLKEKFRSEQIARLGSNHVIYPALSSSAYEKIIRDLLSKAGEKLVGKIGVISQFDQTLEQFLYEESVFPTQGVRPVFSAIRTIIEGNFARIVMEIDKRNIHPRKLHWSWKNNNLIVKAHVPDGITTLLKVSAKARLKELRLNCNKEIQSLVATHESGHAVAAIRLLGRTPDQVISASVMKNQFGYVKLDMKDHILNKRNLTDYLAYLLAGRAAEKMVFGKANLSMGSESDLNEATRLVTAAFYKSGLGDEIGTFAVSGNELNEFMQVPNELKKHVGEIMKEAEKLADQVLADYHKDLSVLLEYLSTNHSISKEGIEKLLNLGNLNAKVKNGYERSLNQFLKNGLHNRKRTTV